MQVSSFPTPQFGQLIKITGQDPVKNQAYANAVVNRFNPSQTQLTSGGLIIPHAQAGIDLHDEPKPQAFPNPSNLKEYYVAVDLPGTPAHATLLANLTGAYLDMQTKLKSAAGDFSKGLQQIHQAFANSAANNPETTHISL